MQTPHRLLILISLALISCSPFKAFQPSGIGAQRLEVKGDYCTTWVEYEQPQAGVSSISLRCLGADGVWASVSSPTAPNTPEVHYGEPSVVNASNGDFLMLYHRDSAQDGFQIAVSRANSAGWSPLGTLVNVDSSGRIIPAYTQFGATLVEFQGTPFVFWTGWDGDGFLSRFSGMSWEHHSLQDGSSGEAIRHPGILTTDRELYVYYGWPRPSVWSWGNNQLTSLGAVPLATGEYTLYTSLAKWNGKLVIAYSSDNPITSWYDNVSTIKVSILDGGAWKPLGEIPDRPGHDGVNPFLFVIDNQLHILYADYSTDGVPTDYHKVYFRMRVKRWDGSSWQRVGGESPTITLSQRFEFTQINDMIFFSAVLPPSGGTSSQVVMGWQNGTFGQVGNAVVTKSGGFWRARPGHVIPASNQNLSFAGLGTILAPSYPRPPVAPGTTIIENNLTIEPRLVDAPGADFRPQSASAAIDGGANCDEIPADMDGTPHPQGLRCDIGAFEYPGYRTNF